jgi:hypothetical protein
MKAKFEARAIGFLSVGIILLLVVVTILAIINDNPVAVSQCSAESKQCVSTCFDDMGVFAELNGTVDFAGANNSLVACLNQCPHADSCRPSDLVRFLPEPSEDKATAEVKYKNAIDIIARYMERENISIKSDLDDIQYQLFVKELGSATDAFTGEEMETVMEFVQFMDLYENIAQNQQIKAYQQKMEKDPNSLSEEELLDLLELMPYVAPDAIEEAPMNISTTEPNRQLMGFIYPNGYNPHWARSYAYKWAGKRNSYYAYYPKKYGCPPPSDAKKRKEWEDKGKRCWNDCTNFASQALLAGGMKQKRKDVAGWDYKYVGNWYYVDGFLDPPSWTWGGAHNLFMYLKTINTPKEVPKNSPVRTFLKIGDIVSADWSNDGHIDHTGIITMTEDGYARVTGHSTDQKDHFLNKWFEGKDHAKAKIYGWSMEKAKN